MTNAEARFNKIHIRKVYACLAVTCHLHFWQNDRDFLRATVVTRGWNGYRNKSQHRKSTLEKKTLPPFQQGFEPATFQSRVRCVCVCVCVLWSWGEKEIIYLSLHCHHQNDSSIKMGSDENHFNVSVGSDGQSHRTVSTNHNLFEEKGEPKRYRTEVLPLTSLTPYRWAKPAHNSVSIRTIVVLFVLMKTLLAAINDTPCFM